MYQQLNHVYATLYNSFFVSLERTELTWNDVNCALEMIDYKFPGNLIYWIVF